MLRGCLLLGRRLPLALLSAVLEVEPAEHLAKLERLIAAGIRTARGAANVQRKERQEATGEASPRRLSPKKIAAGEAAIRGVRWTGSLNATASMLIAGLELASGREPDGIPAVLRVAIEGVLKR